MGFKPVITYTTRNPRKNEVNGIHYYFISEDEFNKKKKEDFFAETTSYNTISGMKYYGTAKCDLDGDKVLIVNPSGLKTLYNMKELNLISFLICVDESVLKQRLLKRGDDWGEIIRRMAADESDFADIDEYIDFTIENNDEMEPWVCADLIAYIYKKRMEVI